MDIDPVTYTLDIVPETEGRDWLWLIEDETFRGTSIGHPDAGGLIISFPPHGAKDGVMLVTVSTNGSVAFTAHGFRYDTGTVVSVTYYGSCEAAG